MAIANNLLSNPIIENTINITSNQNLDIIPKISIPNPIEEPFSSTQSIFAPIIISPKSVSPVNTTTTNEKITTHPKYILSNAPIVHSTPPGINVKKVRAKELKNVKGILLTDKYLESHFSSKSSNLSGSDSDIEQLDQEDINKIIKYLSSDYESDIDSDLLNEIETSSSKTESFDSIFY